MIGTIIAGVIGGNVASNYLSKTPSWSAYGKGVIGGAALWWLSPFLKVII